MRQPPKHQWRQSAVEGCYVCTICTRKSSRSALGTVTRAAKAPEQVRGCSRWKSRPAHTAAKEDGGARLGAPAPGHPLSAASKLAAPGRGKRGTHSPNAGFAVRSSRWGAPCVQRQQSCSNSAVPRQRSRAAPRAGALRRPRPPRALAPAQNDTQTRHVVTTALYVCAATSRSPERAAIPAPFKVLRTQEEPPPLPTLSCGRAGTQPQCRASEDTMVPAPHWCRGQTLQHHSQK